MQINYLPPSQIQGRLLALAIGFVLVMGLALSLSPAARAQSWQVDYRLAHWPGVLLWLMLSLLAHHQVKKYLPDSDPYLLPIASLLSGWGLLSIWRLTDDFGLRQAAWTAVGYVILILGLRRPAILHFLEKYKYLWLTSGLLLTAATFVLGANPGGAGPRLWLGCCGIYLQPSEPLKLLLVIYLAGYFAKRIPINGKFIPLLAPTLLLTGIALGILLVQRDLGTASIFVFLYAAVVYLASGKRRILLTSAFLLLLFALAGYFFVTVIQQRLLTWLNPWLDPSGQSYQIIQSLLAIANGGLLGRGIGMGSPGLVPVAHSDFIYAALAEETGLIGSLGLFSLIAILITRIFLVAIRAETQFERLLAAGLGTYIGVQSIVILGGNLRLLPLTGVTLPFVSYGGSSLVTSFLALLFLLLISNRNERDPAPLPAASPYLTVPALIGTGLLALSLTSGWWSIVRAADLLTRYDNPRRSIADRYVLRGSLLDRRNTPIAYSSGEPGNYQRIYAYPDLAPVIGYTHNVYGQAGLEAALDDYLRGQTGYPTRVLWWQHLLTGYPPPGLDVRLSIDLSLQASADQLLGETPGALALVNAETGEVLAMASHPSFDPNRLDELGAQLLNAPNSPLFNRASQGRYPPGSVIGPFLLAQWLETGNELPNLPIESLQNPGLPTKRCATLPGPEPGWIAAISSGCPQPLGILQAELGSDALGLLIKLGMLRPSEKVENARISPLNMALAAASLSNQGILPASQISLAVNTPTQGWAVLPNPGNSQRIFSAEAARQSSDLLQFDGGAFWESTGRSLSGQGVQVWYIGGTISEWQGTPLGLAVILEQDNPLLVRAIGRKMLQIATAPGQP